MGEGEQNLKQKEAIISLRRTWIDPHRCSDHNLIFLYMEKNNLKPSSPFKSNPGWMEKVAIVFTRSYQKLWLSN